MFCSQCGNQLVEGTQFCPKCGTPINGVANINNGNVASSQSDVKKPNKKRKKGIVAIALVALVVIILAIRYYNSPTKQVERELVGTWECTYKANWASDSRGEYKGVIFNLNREDTLFLDEVTYSVKLNSDGSAERTFYFTDIDGYDEERTERFEYNVYYTEHENGDLSWSIGPVDSNETLFFVFKDDDENLSMFVAGRLLPFDTEETNRELKKVR
ncbi:MAG: zinc-ribbon domain-containing protein [Lachnospiraceae bacterium]|nr:zinc-ribbon domain-containing protein [Lachnospiraceae bacterium]